METKEKERKKEKENERKKGSEESIFRLHRTIRNICLIFVLVFFFLFTVSFFICYIKFFQPSTSLPHYGYEATADCSHYPFIGSDQGYPGHSAFADEIQTEQPYHPSYQDAMACYQMVRDFVIVTLVLSYDFIVNVILTVNLVKLN